MPPTFTKCSVRKTPSLGFSTIEMLLAFTVGILFLSAALMIAFSDPTLSRQYSLDPSVALAIDTTLDSNALATSTNSIGSTTTSFLHNWEFLDLGNTDGFFTNASAVTDISPCTKEIIHTTSWDSGSSRSREITFGTALGSIDIARALSQSGCDPFPPSAWDDPGDPGWHTNPSDIAGTQSGLDVATIDGTPYAFVTTTNTSQTHDLWVVDVSDIESPEVVSSLETGGVTNTAGLTDVTVVVNGDTAFAYVIQNNGINQLQAIDVSDPESLDAGDIKNTISLAAYGVATGGSNDPIPKVLTYYDGRLYIGMQTTGGPELLIFNVEGSPPSPTFVGSIANSFNHSINDIVVRGNYAYLAIKPGSSAQTTKELMVIDVSGSTPVNTGYGYNASSTANDTEGATSLFIMGSKLYMGRERVSNALEKDLYVFNIADPTWPRVLKTKRLGISTGGGLGTPRVLDILVQGKLGFFATTDTSKSFQVYDMVSNPSDVIVVNPNCNNYLHLPKLIEMSYNDNLIYGATGDQATLSILYDQPSVCAH